MQNIQMAREGSVLVIRVDLSKSLGPSKSGKTILVASTNGNASVPGEADAKLGLNLYRKA
jgi:hypothetical protein